MILDQNLGTFITSENADDLLARKGLIEAGRLAPPVDRTFPLAEVAGPIRHLLDGHARGMVVVEV